MKIEDNVPITTPKIIAKAKLRILSPPSTKIHNNTINVLNEDVYKRQGQTIYTVVQQNHIQVDITTNGMYKVISTNSQDVYKRQDKW